MASTTSAIAIEKLSPAVGASISGVDLHRPLDEATVWAIRDAFVRYPVLCFPGQTITATDQVRFADIFGQADEGWRAGTGQRATTPQSRGVMLISNIRKDGRPVGALPDGEMQFHSDGSHREVPYRATTLYAIKVPSRGGETLFANLSAAYDALSDDMKARLEGLTARHMYDYLATSREAAGEDEENLAAADHPLVPVHPASGRRSLYLSRLMTRHVVGMEPGESAALLEELFDHAERPEFVYAHDWTPGDLLIWDNRCVNHARTDFDPGETRLLRRYTISEPEQD